MKIVSFILNLFNLLLLVFTLVLTLPYLLSLSTNTPVYVDPAFRDHVKSFDADAKKYGVTLDWTRTVTLFSNTVSEDTAAYCVPKAKIVVVSTFAWNRMNESTQKALLYHEWGHCLLRRDHVLAEDSCPVSVMYPYIEPMRRCYSLHQDSYNEELFKNPHNFNTF